MSIFGRLFGRLFGNKKKTTEIKSNNSKEKSILSEQSRYHRNKIEFDKPTDDIILNTLISNSYSNAYNSPKVDIDQSSGFSDGFGEGDHSRSGSGSDWSNSPSNSNSDSVCSSD